MSTDKSSFNDPAACWMLLILENEFRQQFATLTTMSDMFLIVGVCNKLMSVLGIKCFVHVQNVVKQWEKAARGTAANIPEVMSGKTAAATPEKQVLEKQLQLGAFLRRATALMVA